MRAFLAGAILAALLAGGTAALYDYAAITAVEGYVPNAAIHVSDAAHRKGVSR